VTSAGQLGVLASSERYKTAITSMGENTEKLRQLRPVSFHLKTDPTGTVQYGLIAEEVDKVYPELVIRDDAGKIQGVRYDELAPMLLNEMQRERERTMETIQGLAARNAEQAAMIAAQARDIQDMQQQLAELNELKQEMHAAIRQLKSKDPLVARR